MIIERSTKERFVKMLEERQIIVVRSKTDARRMTNRYKFIGVNSDGKWDFTPMVAELTRYRCNAKAEISDRVIYATDSASVICDVIDNLLKDGLCKWIERGGEMYFKVRDLLTVFYM